jgi:deoxycytidylate deaminase
MLASSSVVVKEETSDGLVARKIVMEQAAEELVFAVVGHVGSGTTETASALVDALKGAGYDSELLKASHEIDRWSKGGGDRAPLEVSLSRAEALQNSGDAMRSNGDYAAVAAALIGLVRETRAAKLNQSLVAGEPVVPDGKQRAYVLDSVRHPAEIELLRRVYGNAFSLVGVVCQEETRESRLANKYSDEASPDAIRAFMARDSKAPEKHGQRVSDAFHMADYFVDNSPDRWLEHRRPNVHWTIPEQLSRLVKIIQRKSIQHPYIAETAMYMAQGARFRSSCLSRQVGAALLSKDGEVVAVGTNDVPRPGGGLCGPGWAAPEDNARDGRCVHGKGCMSTEEQDELAKEVAAHLVKEGVVSATYQADLAGKLRKTRIGELIEYSRAVHAEMEALLAAARKGTSTKGTRMFVTTYPCHYCARHIVSAGVDEVQYIEPYPKSRARRMHGDAITVQAVNWKAPSLGGDRVLFRPFTGVAPRLYARAFLKDRDLKDDTTGAVTNGLPEWGTSWYIARASYAEMEAKISQNR